MSNSLAVESWFATVTTETIYHEFDRIANTRRIFKVCFFSIDTHMVHPMYEDTTYKCSTVLTFLFLFSFPGGNGRWLLCCCGRAARSPAGSRSRHGQVRQAVPASVIKANQATWSDARAWYRWLDHADWPSLGACHGRCPTGGSPKVSAIR